MEILAIIIIAFGFVMQYLLIFGPKQDNPFRMFVCKTCASICFAAAGVIAVCRLSGGRAEILIVAGLIAGMLGDALLHLRFVVCKTPCLVAGALAFLAGHGAYIAAMLIKVDQWYLGLVFVAIVFPAVCKYIFSHEADFGNFLAFGVVYMIVEVCFSGLAFMWLAESGEKQALLFFMGSIIFVFSDVMWILQNFAVQKKPAYRTLCLVPYYLAQNLFVFSLLL